MAISIVQGNLLYAPEAYIGHQCNCLTAGPAAGLAKLLFARFPYADTYTARKAPSEPGTYSLHGNGTDRRFVINLYAQYHPGRAKARTDTKADRLVWFVSGLEKFIEDIKPEIISLPLGIGCGLAGGNWNDYLAALDFVSTKHHTEFRLYQLTP